MRAPLGALALALLAGCPKSVPPPDFNSTPRLPSPEAGGYARLAQSPEDPVVAWVIGERTWDAYLAGAASGLALDVVAGIDALQPWRVRDATWRAGYPYPVRALQHGSVPSGSAPPAAIIDWLAGVSPSWDVGLVRARGPSTDEWIGLAAAPPSAGLPPIPRLFELGEVLPLDMPYELTDPLGSTASYTTPATLGEAGEWLLAVPDLGVVLPLYVDLLLPTDPVWPDTVKSTTTEGAVLELLGELGSIYSLRALERDPYADAVASSLLTGADFHDTARELGLDPDSATRLSCKARSVVDCLDSLLWSATGRAALLSGEYRQLGIASASEQDRVRIELVLSEG